MEVAFLVPARKDVVNGGTLVEERRGSQAHPTVVHTAPLTTEGLAELKLRTNCVHISRRNKGIPHSMLATTARQVPDGLQPFEACILLTLGNH